MSRYFWYARQIYVRQHTSILFDSSCTSLSVLFCLLCSQLSCFCLLLLGLDVLLLSLSYGFLNSLIFHKCICLFSFLLSRSCSLLCSLSLIARYLFLSLCCKLGQLGCRLPGVEGTFYSRIYFLGLPLLLLP